MDETEKLAMGRRIRQERLKLGLSQSELASRIADLAKTKCHKTLASHWELGKIANPQNNTFLVAADIFGCSPQWLATGKKAKVNTTAISSRRSKGKDTEETGYKEPIRKVVSSLGLQPEVAQKAIRAINRVLADALAKI